MPQFMQDVEQIRDRARRRIEEGAVTDAYRGDKQRAINILNEALATEIVCVLRYLHHYFMATGVHGKSVADEFKEHADAERDHADQIAERIQQLGGKPDFNPRSLLERSASQYVEGESLADMIREDLVAERIVIEVYTDMIRHFADNDPTTRVMLEGILKDEEEHATDLTDLLYIVDPRSGQTEGQDPGTRPLELHGGDGRREQREQQSQREQGRGGQRAERQQPRVSQREAGRTFAGSERPNPPQAIRGRDRNQQQQRGQQGQRQPSRGGNGGNQPLEPSYFQGGQGGGRRESRPERGSKRKGAA